MMKKLVLSILLSVATSHYAMADFTDREASEIISQFYKQYVFVFVGRKEFNSDAHSFGTSRFLKKLERAYSAAYDCYRAPCYGFWALRTDAQDGDGASILSDIRPTKNKGWYRVSYLDMGHKGITDVKVVEKNGIIKLDDYRRVYQRFRWLNQ